MFDYYFQLCVQMEKTLFSHTIQYKFMYLSLKIAKPYVNYESKLVYKATASMEKNNKKDFRG